MIKFFRKIRQNLIHENKMGKYFKYAIGEIILVVIGILIALQINNWNEKKKQLKLEQSILLEMKENLQFDLADIRGNITRDNNYKTATLRVLKNLENQTSFQDSLKADFGKLGQGSIFVKNTSAFENLKSLGFNLISNDNLRQKITFLYSARYEYADVIFRGYDDFIFKRFHVAMNEVTSSQTGNYFSRKPNDYNKLLEDKPFMELLREDLFIKEFSHDFNLRLEQDVLELISLIEEELDND